MNEAELDAELQRLLAEQERRRSIRRNGDHVAARLGDIEHRVVTVEHQVESLNVYLSGQPDRPHDIGVLGRLLIDVAEMPERLRSIILETQSRRELGLSVTAWRWVLGILGMIIGGTMVGLIVANVHH